MNTCKLTREQVAILRWQNVIAFGAADSHSHTSNKQQNHKAVIFDVLP